MTNTFLCILAAVFCGLCSCASLYHYYLHKEGVGKRFPLHFGFSGEPDNWSESPHAFKLFPAMVLTFSILTVVLAAVMPFWPGVGLVLCMSSSIVTICVIQYYGVLISKGTMTRVPPLQFYSCLILILITTILCVVLSVVSSLNPSSSTASSLSPQ